MPIYAVCSNTFCAQILELRDEQASARAIPAPEFCRSCGSRLISKCWFCSSLIVRPSQPDQVSRCEFCRVDLRQRATVCSSRENGGVDTGEHLKTRAAVVGGADIEKRRKRT